MNSPEETQVINLTMLVKRLVRHIQHTEVPEPRICSQAMEYLTRTGPVKPTDILRQHIDSDRYGGPSDWDRECQESRRLNR